MNRFGCHLYNLKYSRNLSFSQISNVFPKNKYTVSCIDESSRRKILLPSFFIKHNLYSDNYGLNLLNNLNSHGISHFHTASKLHQEEDSESNSGILTREFSKIRNPVSVISSMRYLESEEYKITYGDKPVWVRYRRNHKGQFAPKLTRATCIEENVLVSGNPCPICRDEYLVVDFRNVKLLKQFVCPYTDRILFWDKTCLCQRQQRKVEVEIFKARKHGLLPFYVPFRDYDYKDYYDFDNKKMKY